MSLMVVIIMFVAAEPMDITPASTSQACEIPSSDVTILEGHTSEVGACFLFPCNRHLGYFLS